MAIVAEQLVDEDVLVDSPEGSSITHVFRLYDDGGLQITRLACYTWADANYPRGQALADFPNLKVHSREYARLTNDTHGFMWIVKIMYRTSSFGGLGQFPWDDAPRFEWLANAFDVPMEVDASSTPKTVVNTAGDPFENPPTELRVYGELRYSRNVNPNSNLYDLIRAQMIEQNNNVVYANSDQYTIMRIGGGNGLIVPAERSVMWIEGVVSDVRDNVSFAAVRFGFRFYTTEYADEVDIYSYGYNQLVAGVRTPIVFKGETPRQPQPLSSAGALVDLIASPTSTPHLLTFKRHVSLEAFAPYAFV